MFSEPKQPIPLPRHELQPSHCMELLALGIITDCPGNGMTLKSIADMSTDDPADRFPEAKALFGLIILNPQHTCNARKNQAVQPPEPAMPAQSHPAAAMKEAEAKAKWCPFLPLKRNGFGEVHEDSRCLGSACMAWYEEGRCLLMNPPLPTSWDKRRLEAEKNA